jgi:hypothetical protein
MNLIPIEAPAARITSARELPEFFNAALSIVSTRNRLQVVADQLIETLTQGFRLPSSTGYELLIYGESYIHVHSICGHVLCVNGSFEIKIWPAHFLQDPRPARLSEG